jgi:hypothetical protein
MAVPRSLRPLAASDERKWVTAVIEESRQKLALDLDPTPTLERGVGLQSRVMRKLDFMIVGGSHAARTARILEESGYSVSRIIDTTWSISRASCDTLAILLANKLKLEDPDVVILQLLDTSIYYAKSNDGSRVMPRKMEDGTIHIEGELVVASSETQFEHYLAMKPIIEAIGRRPCILISPIPMFMVDGCCREDSHITNRQDRDYRANLERQLDGVATKFKNLLYNAGKRFMRVLDTGHNIRGREDADVWGVDPIHPIESVYRSLVASIFQMAATLKDLSSRVETKRRREDSREDSLPHSRRQREEEDRSERFQDDRRGRGDTRGRGRGWTTNRGGGRSFRGSSSYMRGYGGQRH